MLTPITRSPESPGRCAQMTYSQAPACGFQLTWLSVKYVKVPPLACLGVAESRLVPPIMMLIGFGTPERFHQPLNVCESVESLMCTRGPPRRSGVRPCGTAVITVITFLVSSSCATGIVFCPSFFGPLVILVMGLAALKPP